MNLRIIPFSLLFSLLMVSIPTLISAYPVGGITPDQRPVDAPVIKEFKKSGDWYARALYGVEKPYPPSFRFLEDQGGWYTPFNHPGMTGPYDIRNWHKK